MMTAEELSPSSFPLRRWLDDRKITPQQLSILSNVDAVIVYLALRGYIQTLPVSFVEAIRSYYGDGADLADKYQDWRMELWREVERQQEGPQGGEEVEEL